MDPDAEAGSNHRDAPAGQRRHTKLDASLEAQRQNESMAEALLEAASEGVVLVDDMGRMVMANRRTEEMFGYTHGELLGRPLEILVPPALREQHAQHRKGFFTDPRTRPMGRGLDLAGIRKDGTQFPIEISLSYVKTQDGVQALGFISDISGRIAAEQAARQAERLAALGRLAAGVAHEVNNPIGIIASRIELMLVEAREHSLPAAVVADLEVIHRHATRVATIAQRLLSFARESPRAQAPLDLNPIVREALTLLEKQPGKEAVAIRTVLGDPLPKMLGDAAALGQVVFNIVANAVQAIDERGEIIVTTTGDAKRIRLVVSDTGPGIPSEILGRIFDPFFTTKPQGTGLGLSITYGIVRDHHGTIDVESAPGRGTTFTLTFPATPGESPS